MDLRTRITGLNAFLSEIYGDGDMRLSRFLARVGIGDDDIEAIRRNHMEELAAGCIALLSQEPFKHDERSFKLISLRMGLDGAPPKTLREIGDVFGISRERVRQLEQTAFARFKIKTILAQWEAGIRELVIGLLRPSGESGEAHPYIIETDADPDGNKRMIINKGDGAVRNPDIVLTDNTFASFYHDFMAAAKRLGWNRLIQSYSLSEVKKRFPRAYEKWTDEEDQTLKASFSKGADIMEQSALLGRQPTAIRSRLEKLGLMAK